MKVINQEGRRPIKAWVGNKTVNVPVFDHDDGSTAHQDMQVLDIEDSALEQLKNISGLPFIHRNGVVAMPDVHFGIGATVGSVIASQGAVIPAAVGVDIGCGMNAVRTNLKASGLPDSLAALRHSIERAVPTGKFMHTRDATVDANDLHIQRYVGVLPAGVTEALATKRRGDTLRNRSAEQLGTLGGGNHFIEVCLDEEQNVWVMLHSGSRGIGNIIGRHFIEVAKKRMEEYFITLPHADLAYLPEDTPDFNNYVAAVGWAQTYAMENRRVMMEAVLEQLRRAVPKPLELTEEAINCHHNYIDRENHFGDNLWVTRKGAIRAREGDLGIIPGSMGQRSFIVRGKGNPESYCSCSHGAGRAMSRTAARAKFTVADLIAQTQGVECLKTDAVLDELPSGYKDIDVVMANQTDLVEVLHTLKQVLCVKGA